MPSSYVSSEDTNLSSSRRLAVLHGHIGRNGSGKGEELVGKRDLEMEATGAWATTWDETNSITEWLYRDGTLELRRSIYDFLKDPLYSHNYYLSLAGYRELTSQRVKKFVEQGFFSTADYIRAPLRFQAALESLSYCDYSLAIKSGVHFTLCGGTIAKLGTERHHREILPKMDTLELPGCFGMTELGHGSNVMGIETTAEFDPVTDSFIIHTPNNEASKYWIGGAAQTAKICAVFAQLTVKDPHSGQPRWEGPHVFVVRLRDDQGNVVPGVRIIDCGAKQGLNGVDNGQIWFDRVHVPRDSLLDKYCSIDANGKYSSPIKSPLQRFGTMISGLTTGRMLIAQAAVDAQKLGVSISLRYATVRSQFGNRNIGEYITHQRRLIPALATAYALHLSLAQCKSLAARAGDSMEVAKQVHVLSSGLKAAATWHRVRILQDCRECCGGMGFLAENKIGPMLNDMNVDTTFEGDNTVMMQQVAKGLVDAAAKDRVRKIPTPPAVNVMDLGPGCVSKLLEWRRDAIAAEIVIEGNQFSVEKGPEAVSKVFDAQLDRAVELGWASVDASTFATFRSELSCAPSAWQDSLTMLALLYGLTRIESGLADLLSFKALPGEAVVPLRRKINGICHELNKGGTKSTAIQLCKGFGIPEHLLQAPIAISDWRLTGSSL